MGCFSRILNRIQTSFFSKKNDMIFFLKCKGIFSHNCGYASLRKKNSRRFCFMFHCTNTNTWRKAPSAPKWLQAMKDPRKTPSKVGQADPATQPFERRDDSTFFCVCCQMMVIFCLETWLRRNVWWTRRRTFLWLTPEYDGVCRNIFCGCVGYEQWLLGFVLQDYSTLGIFLVVTIMISTSLKISDSEPCKAVLRWPEAPS